MEQVLIYVSLTILGLCLGSFAGATVWRLRARQLVEDKVDGEEIDKKEYKKLLPLTKTTLTTDRSRCLHCGHVLHWYDLLPLFSWLSTGGKCRYCHHQIGWFEPLIELSMAFLFIGSYLLWPVTIDAPLVIAMFVVWLIVVVLLVILFAYDLKWFILPNRIIFPLIALSAAFAGLSLIDSPDLVASLSSLAGAVVILSGLYLLLWLLSKGQWIGFGDVKLGLALALLLGDWQLALLALFLANAIGCIIVLPGMVMGKVTRTTRIPFGPLLIIGGLLAGLIGSQIIEQYLAIFS